jgi:hypothetical protein
MELVSTDVTNNTINTKQFGDVKARSNGGGGILVMMTDAQVSKVQAFLKSKKNQ